MQCNDVVCILIMQVTKRGIHRKSALRRSSSSVFVKSKQVKQLEVRGSEVLSGEVLVHVVEV